ncbi:hypothetical protein ACFE04_009946 [Oxalis oulophora]
MNMNNNLPESKTCSTEFNIKTKTSNGVTTVEIHLPGFKEHEVRSAYDEKQKCICIQGSKYFYHTIPLKEDDFEAKFDDETLTITIPKKDIVSTFVLRAKDVKGGLFMVTVVACSIVAAGAFLTYRLISSTRLKKSNVK